MASTSTSRNAGHIDDDATTAGASGTISAKLRLMTTLLNNLVLGVPVSGLAFDASGNLKITLGSLLAGENQTTNRLETSARYTYGNIVASGSTTLKSSAGLLHSICVNAAGSGTQIFQIFDAIGPSGTKIGTILGTTQGAFYLYDVTFNTGLTIVALNAAAIFDLTVAYL